jgi:hypothetical protein
MAAGKANTAGGCRTRFGKDHTFVAYSIPEQAKWLSTLSCAQQFVLVHGEGNSAQAEWCTQWDQVETSYDQPLQGLALYGLSTGD